MRQRQTDFRRPVRRRVPDALWWALCCAVVLLFIYILTKGTQIESRPSFPKSIHDEVLSEEVEMDGVQTDNFTPRPLVRLQNYLAELKPCKNVDDKTLSLNEVIRSCKTEMYHYARVSGLHVLECVMDTALPAVKREHIETKFHFLRDQVSKGRIKLVYCKTEDQIADVLTKPLKIERFKAMRKLFNMYSLDSLN